MIFELPNPKQEIFQYINCQQCYDQEAFISIKRDVSNANHLIANYPCKAIFKDVKCTLYEDNHSVKDCMVYKDLWKDLCTAYVTGKSSNIQT